MNGLNDISASRSKMSSLFGGGGGAAKGPMGAARDEGTSRLAYRAPRDPKMAPAPAPAPAKAPAAAQPSSEPASKSRRFG